MTKLPIAYRNEEDWAIWVDERLGEVLTIPGKQQEPFLRLHLGFLRSYSISMKRISRNISMEKINYQ